MFMRVRGLPCDVKHHAFNFQSSSSCQGAYSDNGSPSSSRLVSTFLSVGCLLIIAVLFRHLMYQPEAKLTVWLPNIPYIIGALAVFSQSPYGLTKIRDIFNRAKKEEEPKAEEPAKT